jgi:ABC-type dipeptide/oligopeptide/nickel transport system permease subunit
LARWPPAACPTCSATPWIPLAPTTNAVFLLAFATNLAGDGLRDLLEDH